MSYANRVVIVIAAVLAVFFAPVSTSRAANPYGFVPPTGTHLNQLGPASFTAMHEDGYDDPAVNCTLCHGDGQGGLRGGVAPSCFTCHGDYWTYFSAGMTQWPENQTGFGVDPPYEAYLANPVQLYPDSHTVAVGSIMPLSGGDSGTNWACWYCHPSYYGYAGPDKFNFFHAPGHGTPHEAGCDNCHGSDLHGTDGFAISCRWCHQDQWVGGEFGSPPDHQNLDTWGNPRVAGADLKGGFAWHRQGWDNPYSVFSRNPSSPDGCTRCHGPNLNDGFAPSCFTCHGPGGSGPPTDHTVVLGVSSDHKPGFEDPFGNGCAQCHGEDLTGGFAPSCYACHGSRWDPHDFSGELWLPPGDNTCYVCHLPPDFNQTGPVWNHVPATSTYVVTDAESLVTATVGQPNGTSAKCMDCHEGAPSGPAVEDYGSATGGVYFVEGEEAFGTDLTQHHPVSFNYLDADQTGLNDPAVTPSGRTRHGTIASDILEGGQVQCTSCHDQHDNTKGNYLFETTSEGSCFICHKRHSTTALQHHIPGRLDPWGVSRGITFNCTMCHGESLEGDGQDIPACTDCHNQFAYPDTPAPGHHGGNRDKPYFDCASCHADPLTGVVTGNRFGTSHAPSCYKCHDDLWNVADNYSPIVDAGGPYTGTVGQAITFDASDSNDPEGDPLVFAWSFGDGSQAQMPSHDAKTQHTFSAPGVYHAAISVTDGVNPPKLVLFDVAIDAAPAQAPDTWNVTTGHPLPESFAITFEDHSGSLVGVKDDGGLAFGIEYVGVIYWMEVWMDLSGNAYWGTGDIFFGNIDREAGTMTGVVFDADGDVVTFSGTKP